jgi:hypothetical protein
MGKSQGSGRSGPSPSVTLSTAPPEGLRDGSTEIGDSYITEEGLNILGIPVTVIVNSNVAFRLLSRVTQSVWGLTGWVR